MEPIFSNEKKNSILTNNNQLGVIDKDQLRKLTNLLERQVYIHGRSGFPTITFCLKDFISKIKKRLSEKISVRDVRINGGVASYILAEDNRYSFNDIDIIFYCDLLQTDEKKNETITHKADQENNKNKIYISKNFSCISRL
jgi:hypothetical protein